MPKSHLDSLMMMKKGLLAQSQEVFLYLIAILVAPARPAGRRTVVNQTRFAVLSMRHPSLLQAEAPLRHKDTRCADGIL